MKISSTEKKQGESCQAKAECIGDFGCVLGQCKCPDDQYEHGTNQCAESK